MGTIGASRNVWLALAMLFPLLLPRAVPTGLRAPTLPPPLPPLPRTTAALPLLVAPYGERSESRRAAAARAAEEWRGRAGAWLAEALEVVTEAPQLAPSLLREAEEFLWGGEEVVAVRSPSGSVAWRAPLLDEAGAPLGAATPAAGGVAQRLIVAEAFAIGGGGAAPFEDGGPPRPVVVVSTGNGVVGLAGPV